MRKKKMKEDDFDAFVNELQEEVKQKDREDFSEYALSLADNPYHYGSMDDASMKKKCAASCGDTLTAFIRVDDGVLKEVSYEIAGCSTLLIAGSQMVKMAEGLSIEKALELTPEMLDSALGRYPDEDIHCLRLAIKSLHTAINAYLKK